VNPSENWRDRGACRDLEQPVMDAFFVNTEDGDQVAVAICQQCPVRAECLAFAVASGEQYGVWGGRTQAQVRRLIARDRRGRTRVAASASNANAAKRSCVRGHPFDQVNTYYTRDGRRRCRACLRDSWATWACTGRRRTRSARQGGGQRG
jgi:WhiB family transcriptional regulator, redox-sensing transcriptional regulator